MGLVGNLGYLPQSLTTRGPNDQVTCRILNESLSM